MQHLFHPVRLLLTQFRRPWVVAACALVMAGLLAALAQGMFGRILDQLEATGRELAGLGGVARVRAVLQPLQEHRGLDHAVLHGDPALGMRRTASAMRVDAAFAALLTHPGLMPEHRTEAVQMQNTWRSLLLANGEDRFDAHSALIDRLLELARRVIDDSGLILDADAGAYHLIGALDVMLGFTLERAAQLRGLHAALLASGGADVRLRGELVVCASALDDERKLVSHHVAALLRYRPDLAAELGDLPTRLEQATLTLRRLVREHVAAPGAELSAEMFFEQASVVIGDGYALFDRTLALTERILHVRMEEQRRELGWRIAGMLALLLTIAYLFVGVVQSVRDSRRAEAERLLAARVFEHAGEAIMVTDADNRIVKVNPAFNAITGYATEEVLGQTPGRFKSGHHDAAFYRALWRSLNETGAWEGEIWDRRRNGEIYPKWLTINAIRDPEGPLRHYVALFTDISERKRSEERIRHLAEHDALTGLPNRALLQDRLSQAMARAERAHSRLALLYVDLDRFKQINDTLGHPVGDALLQEMSRRLQATVRASDTVCRQGGDEFLVLLDEIESSEDVARVAQKMIETLAQPFRVASHDLCITTSIGISLYPDDSTDVASLIRNADIALYRAKEGGRNAFRFCNDDTNPR
ncbi:MAG: diguanylate cyclase [Betaproteobacteria bacterium]|nr:diguanylate cyclase [Betaproteobacteria bacterium]